MAFEISPGVDPNSDQYLTESEFEYKFNEDEYVQEIKQYIDSTYQQHYSGKYQATDMIIDAGHGTGFCVGSIMKYAKRYGKKNGFDRKDILKIIHYGIILLHVHDQTHVYGPQPPDEEFVDELNMPNFL